MWRHAAWTLLLLRSVPGGLAGHPCEQEVSTACPDRPANELASCLKTPSEHEAATELSSECTDFVALNAACEEDIVKHCDEAFFSEDTTLCLKTWTDPESISPKCLDVMKWAIPKGDDEESGPTDELGLSDEDKAQMGAEGASKRSEKYERIKKMKAEDAAKEKERLELEKFKQENPEEHAAMLQQQEEEARQKREFKKRERMIAAALERKKRQEAGIKDEEDEPKKEEEPKKQKRSRRPPPSYNGGGEAAKGSWTQALLSLGFVAAILAGGYYLIVKLSSESSKKKKGKKPKVR